MRQEQFDSLINYINAKVANATGRMDTDGVIIAHEWAEESCVDEPDRAVTQPFVIPPTDPHF